MVMQYMGPWVPSFTNAVNKSLENQPFVSFYLATVDEDGSPRVRTCAFRGFVFGDKKTNILTCTTDIRMGKYEHLTKNPKFEACFWFPETNEQFRLSGNAKLLKDDNVDTINSEMSDYPLVSPNYIKHHGSSTALSKLHQDYSTFEKPTAEEWRAELSSKWDCMSDKVKDSFRNPCPGTKVDLEKQKLLDSIARGVDGSNAGDGQKFFALILLLVEKVDYLKVSNQSTRFIFERYDDDQWTEDEVCP